MSAREYGVTKSPTGFLIDHEGTILRREIAFHPGMFADLEDRITDLIAVKTASQRKP